MTDGLLRSTGSFADRLVTDGLVGSIAALLIPVNTVLPSISGTAQEWQTLTCSTGTWTNSPTLYAYQWYEWDSGTGTLTDIPGATTNTYQPQSGDVGGYVTCGVVAINGSGSGEEVYADPVGPIAAAPVGTLVPWNLDEPTWNQGDLLPTGVYIFKWENLTVGDIGVGAEVPFLTEKHVACGGDYGVGGEVLFEVEDAASGTARWATALDTANAPMSFQESDGNPATKSVRPVGFKFRPNVIAGDENTSLTVRMLVKP